MKTRSTAERTLYNLFEPAYMYWNKDYSASKWRMQHNTAVVWRHGQAEMMDLIHCVYLTKNQFMYILNNSVHVSVLKLSY